MPDEITRYEMPQRYDVDGHGELPVSYGRLCLLAKPLRWED